MSCFINRDINNESIKRGKRRWLDSYLVSCWAFQVFQPYVDVCPQTLTIANYYQQRLVMWHFHLHALDFQLPSEVFAVGGTAGKSHPETVHRARAGPVHRLHHRAKDTGVLHHLVRALLRSCVVVLQHLLNLSEKEPNGEGFLFGRLKPNF